MYTKTGKLLCGGASAAAGGFLVSVENTLNITIEKHETIKYTMGKNVVRKTRIAWCSLAHRYTSAPHFINRQPTDRQTFRHSEGVSGIR